MNFNQLCKSDLCKVVFFCVVAYLVWHFLLKRVVREGYGTGNDVCPNYKTESNCNGVGDDWCKWTCSGGGDVGCNCIAGSGQNPPKRQ